MPTSTFSFVNGQGRRLAGRLEMPERICRGWAVLAHCFTCGKDSRSAVAMGRGLAAQGIGVLRFDFSGIGDSEGDADQSSFSLNVDDLVQAAAAMAAADMPVAMLIGHSLGGTAALVAAARIPSVRAVATVGAPFDAAHLLRHVPDEALRRIGADGTGPVPLGGFEVRVGQAFIDDVRTHDTEHHLAGLTVPLLILHSPVDQVVDIDNASRIFLAARHSKSFISLDKADHLLRDRADAEHATAVIAAWAGRYLPEPTALPGRVFDAEAEETGLGKFQLALQSGGSRWLADEPTAVGGLGSGPTPYNLLSSALAACTTMTLRHFADLKGWPLERVRTGVDHRKVKDRTPPDEFTRHIRVEGELDAKQLAALADVAARCPVHRTLAQGATFAAVTLTRADGRGEG
ncbi:bifunctional alpha/beta hydrolase/OsmC family protein [Piscinibacter gummiphilus]|uniref:Osmotically inducible protein C n=1 Tax=Piscinibacter gummiphilus TaxID=946333 RepID=A0A1W6LGP8_9BURK|nr:bifunctional alpha/beta hydrolase/OsmC family protein [Piscinibacter gummiphilus]ARN23377.1 osmotically inducible protein C [Piscinibacter gummiphilus]ATU68080.1 OsmC family protein [Piscinibacter gummiphilus]GLS97384.1 osmotically inducible protein C [Piscinibacter gummiphilus]